jgi:hypothetical protein
LTVVSSNFSDLIRKAQYLQDVGKDQVRLRPDMGHGLNPLNTIGCSGVDLSQLFLRIIGVVVSAEGAFLVVDSRDGSIVAADNELVRIRVPIGRPGGTDVRWRLMAEIDKIRSTTVRRAWIYRRAGARPLP